MGQDDYYSAIAPGYDALHGAEQDEKLEWFLGKVRVHPDASILDVGCGTGRSKRFFSSQDWKGIEPARGLIAHADPAAKDRIQLCKAEDIPYNDDAFDIVLSLTAIQNFDDPAKGLDEIKRVGKGLFLLSFLKKSAKRDLLDALIRERFSVLQFFDQEKDWMYVCVK